MLILTRKRDIVNMQNVLVIEIVARSERYFVCAKKDVDGDGFVLGVLKFVRSQ